MTNAEPQDLIRAADDMLASAQALVAAGDFLKAEPQVLEVLRTLEPFIDGSVQNVLETDGATQSEIIKLVLHALNRLAIISENKGDYETSIQYAHSALQYCERYDMRDRVVGLHIALGNAYRCLSDYPAALQHYSQAQEVAVAGHNEQGAASALGSIGTVYLFLRDYSSALDYYTKALERHTAVNFKGGMKSWLSNIGTVYVYLNQHKSALEYFLRALALEEELGDKSGVARCLGNIAIIHKHDGDFASALEYSNKALLMYEQLGMKTSAAIEYINLSVTHTLIKDFEHSLEFLNRGMKMAQDLGDRSLVQQISYTLGQHYSNDLNPYRDDTVAERHLLSSISLADELGIKNYEAYKLLSEIYKNQSRWQESRESLERSYLLEQQVQSEEASQQASLLEHKRKIEDAERDRQVKLARFQEQEKILHNILPEQIAERILDGEEQIADYCENVSVFFSDIVGFTKLSAQVSPAELVEMLNQLFSQFDRVARKYGLEKIKTIGDAYMAVAGVPEPMEDHAENAARFALEVMDVMKAYRMNAGNELEIRVGLHTGSAVAGVIGENKFAYDLWGDAVNTASRMESHGEPGRIHVSQDFKRALGHSLFSFEERGEIEVKGKGTMTTYFLNAAP